MIDLPSGVTLVTFTKAKIYDLWEKFRGLDKMFGDEVRGNIETFAANLMKPNSITVEIDGGLLHLDNIKIGNRAEVHMSIWDKHLSEKTNVIKDLLLCAFLAYDLKRIETFLMDISHAVKRFVEKKLGFTFEGRLRKRVSYKGELIDQLVYSILREEVI
uniref:Putative acetyltransferase n=1 Tax=viral metagenome TaxID=1070528 RepID=A0A6M3K104_9ZZZZ